jgi:hypothetical protein
MKPPEEWPDPSLYDRGMPKGTDSLPDNDNPDPPPPEKRYPCRRGSGASKDVTGVIVGADGIPEIIISNKIMQLDSEVIYLKRQNRELTLDLKDAKKLSRLLKECIDNDDFSKIVQEYETLKQTLNSYQDIDYREKFNEECGKNE